MGESLIIAKCPDDYFKNEREYIYDVILNDFLGLEYKLEFENRDDLCIFCDDKEIIVDDTFFRMAEVDYLTANSMPDETLDCWDCQHEEIANLFVCPQIPIIYGKRLPNKDYICVQDGNKIHVGIDIFGSAFFMLTRYEEVIPSKRVCDDFGRFPSTYSISGKNGFVERPIINEYVELLKWFLKKSLPEQLFKKRTFNIILTHDVDRPSAILDFRAKTPHIRRLLGDLLVRRSIPIAIRRWKIFWEVFSQGYQSEWRYTFDYIMDKSEEMGLKSTFFFMAHKSQHPVDGDYYIDDTNIISLINHIHKRGHKIALHPEYNSYNNEVLIRDNVDRFRKIMADNQISFKEIGARQHYLRWSPETWQHYEDNGIDFDTTLSFADHIGFRCGICYDYPVYNLKRREKLKLREYPLVVMDGSALVYMDLSLDEAVNRIVGLKGMCRKYNGTFVLLWHNDMFLDDKLNKIYDEILRG